MYCVIIDKISTFWDPVDVELPLHRSVLDPKVTHVDCFQHFLLYGTISETHCLGVIHLNGRWGLRVAHVNHHITDRNSLPCVHVCGSNLRFSGRPEDVLLDFF